MFITVWAVKTVMKLIAASPAEPSMQSAWFYLEPHAFHLHYQSQRKECSVCKYLNSVLDLDINLLLYVICYFAVHMFFRPFSSHTCTSKHIC